MVVLPGPSTLAISFSALLRAPTNHRMQILRVLRRQRRRGQYATVRGEFGVRHCHIGMQLGEYGGVSDDESDGESERRAERTSDEWADAEAYRKAYATCDEAADGEADGGAYGPADGSTDGSTDATAYVETDPKTYSGSNASSHCRFRSSTYFTISPANASANQSHSTSNQSTNLRRTASGHLSMASKSSKATESKCISILHERRGQVSKLLVPVSRFLSGVGGHERRGSQRKRQLALIQP